MSLFYFNSQKNIKEEINDLEIQNNEESEDEDNKILLKYTNQEKIKQRRKRNPFPIKCCVCGRITGGYIFYNVICCDGCKHFFSRCINTRNFYKCKNEGNCDIMNVANKCKSCRFDKCIIKGMCIKILRNNSKPELFWELQTLIEQKRRELALKGKYVERKEKNYSLEENNFKILQKSLMEGQNTQIVESLLFVEKNAKRIRNSPTEIHDWHFNYSCKSLKTLLTRKENLLYFSQEYVDLEQKLPEKSFIKFLHEKGSFSIRPPTLVKDLLLIVDIFKTMPFFQKLEISDMIYQLTNITMPLYVLISGYYSSTKMSETIILPSGFPIILSFGDKYKQNLIINNYLQKLFNDVMKPFNQIKLNEEEYVLLQAIICSHYVTNGVSKQGLELLLNEAEKYCGILIKMLQNNYGQFVGAKRYSELLHLIEFCFKCGYNHSLLFNYLANVFDQNLFHKVMPEALADLCLRCKVSSD